LFQAVQAPIPSPFMTPRMSGSTKPTGIRRGCRTHPVRTLHCWIYPVPRRPYPWFCPTPAELARRFQALFMRRRRFATSMEMQRLEKAIDAVGAIASYMAKWPTRAIYGARWGRLPARAHRSLRTASMPASGCFRVRTGMLHPRRRTTRGCSGPIGRMYRSRATEPSRTSPSQLTSAAIGRMAHWISSGKFLGTGVV
jgi:hypothetical protein